jgi:SulP family sulfate permease
VFILRMRLMPMIDSSGVVALEEFIHRCRKQGTKVILSGVRDSVMKLLHSMEVVNRIGDTAFAPQFSDALDEALAILAKDTAA